MSSATISKKEKFLEWVKEWDEIDRLAEECGGYVAMGGPPDETKCGLRAIVDYCNENNEPMPLTEERIMEIDDIIWNGEN